MLFVCLFGGFHGRNCGENEFHIWLTVVYYLAGMPRTLRQFTCWPGYSCAGFPRQRWSLSTNCCPTTQTHINTEILGKQWSKKLRFLTSSSRSSWLDGDHRDLTLWNSCTETNETQITIFTFERYDIHHCIWTCAIIVLIQRKFYLT